MAAIVFGGDEVIQQPFRADNKGNMEVPHL